MPTALASLPPVSPPPPTAVTSPLSASSAANPVQQTPFDRILATAARAAAGSANQTTATGQALTAAGTDTTAPGTPAGAVVDPTQVVAQASAGLLIVGPGVVLSSSGSPVTVPADNSSRATGTRPTNPAETLSRADQLRLQLALAPQSLPQPVATRVSPLSTAAAQAAARKQQQQTDTAAAQNQPTAVPIPGSPANPIGTPLTAQIPLPATGLPAGRAVVVPPQVPIVADLVPPTAAPVHPLDTPPQPVAAAVAPAAVPDVRVGGHPSTAGERFAAIAADAARLKAQVSQPAAGAFAAALARSTTTDRGPNTAPVAPAAPAAGKDLTPGSAGVLVGPTVAPQSAVVPAAVPVPDGRALVNAATTAGRGVPPATTGPVDRASAGGAGVATVFRVQTTGVALATPPVGGRTTPPAAPTAPIPVTAATPAPTPTTVGPTGLVTAATTAAAVSGGQTTGGGVTAAATPGPTNPAPTAGTAANPPAALAAPAPAQTVQPAAPAFPMVFDGAGGFAALLRERAGGIGATTTAGADQSAAAGAAGNPLAGPAAPLPPQTTPAAVAAAPPTPALQIADGVIAHARTLTPDGTTEFRLRLDPPELGRVNVNLISDGDSIRGQVVVANDGVRQMIESQLPELRQRLEQAGLTVGRFDVSTDPGAGGNGNPYRGNSPAEFVPPTGTPAATAAPRHPQTFPARPPAGGLDVTV
ncbi:MAG: fliK [Gemmataceae bacterium]|nr:fliK [Gemmataceae bacterium]